MKVFVKNIDELTSVCDALILPLTEDKGISHYRDIDKALNGLLKKIIVSREFSGKQNETLLVHTHGKIKSGKVLLVGLGKGKEVTREKLRQAGGKAVSYLRNPGVRNVSLSSRVFSSLKLMPADFIEGSLLSHYRFDRYKKEENHKEIESITVLSGEDLKKQINFIKAAASATLLARDLVSTPANDMTPSALVKCARSLKKVSVKVIEKKQAEELGMGAYLSVSRGSMEPPKFIVITYRKSNTPPIALIGKSVTFDSGGISLKPALGMEKMKYDMAGGAAVLGVMKAASEMNLPLHIIGILPATENLPGCNASKPGDVVKTIDGKTIEIISTDA